MMEQIVAVEQLMMEQIVTVVDDGADSDSG